MKKYFQRASFLLKKKINLIALSFCAISVGFWMILVAQRYYLYLSTGGWDTALFNQILHNLSQGSFYVSLEGANFLTDHCHFYAFLLAPLYWIWPDPMLLRYFQIGVFFAGAYIFFLILKKRLHPFIALGGMVVFTLAPANIAMLRGCFNFEPFAIPFVFLVFKAFDEKKYISFMVFCFFLAMVKEQMPLVVMMFGILAFVVRREDKIKWALTPFLMGMVIFIFDIFILTPYVRQDLPLIQSPQWGLYSKFGKTPSSILLYLLTHPGKIFEQLISPDIIKWYNDLFGTWGSLAFLSPQILFPALPLFFKSILRDFKLEHNVTGVYYASTFTPYIFLAAWNTLNHIQNKWRIWIHSLALIFMFLHALTFMPKWLPLLKAPITTKAMTMHRFINKMPEHASLVGMVDYVRDWRELYWLHAYETGKYHSGKKFVLPDDTEYLLMNFNDKAYEGAISKLMNSSDFHNRWRLDESIEDLALYVRNTSKDPQTRLVEISRKPFLEKNIQSKIFEKIISFEGIEYPEKFSRKNRIFPVTMYWKSYKKTNDVYRVSFKVFLKDKSRFEKHKPIGTTIYSTKYWRVGEYIKENYFYLLPRLDPGEYAIEVRVYNDKTRKWFDCISRKSNQEGVVKRSFIVY